MKYERNVCMYNFRFEIVICVSMSSATKRKHVTKEVVEEYRLPQHGEQIVKVSWLYVEHTWNK